MNEPHTDASTPPSGYRIISHTEPAKDHDLAYLNKDFAWHQVKRGMNIIGASAREMWPIVMEIARKI
jgi:hypothetical protein